VRPRQKAWADANCVACTWMAMESRDGRTPMWDKMMLLRQAFVPGTTLFWLDGDCIPFQKLQLSHLIPESRKIRCLDDTAAEWCTGGMLFPGEEWVPDMLRYWYDMANAEELSHPWQDQYAFHRLLRKIPKYLGYGGTSISRELVCHPCGLGLGDNCNWTKYGFLKERESLFYSPVKESVGNESN
jgi:hypothetical protein